MRAAPPGAQPGSPAMFQARARRRGTGGRRAVSSGPPAKSSTQTARPPAISSRTSPGRRRPGEAAGQRIDRDLALEQPRHLVVGGADAVHDLDRRPDACRARRAPPAPPPPPWPGRSAGPSAKASQVSERMARSNGASLALMGDEAGARARLARPRGDRLRRWRRAAGRRRSSPAAAGPPRARRAQPALERLAHIALGHRLGRRRRPAGPRSARTASGRLGGAVGDLDRVAVLDALRDDRPAALASARPAAATTTMTKIMMAMT